MAKNKYMGLAIKEAHKAYLKDEVPVGAVVVKDGVVIARAHNLREKQQSFYAHAEFLAMAKAAKKLGTWRLEDCEVYVTLEPCPMCAGALIQSRVKKVVYATLDPKAGAIESVIKLLDNPFNHKIESYLDYDEQAKVLLQSFFKKLRNK